MNDAPFMHHIQRSIILTLARTSPLRFTDLQPPRIPNNTFTYHLKKLIDSGYVELTSLGYVPTRKALKLVVYASAEDKNARMPGPVTMVYIENDRGEVLLLNRNRKPFQGWYGIPTGWVHLGETTDEASRRELTEKTMLVADGNLKAAGVLDLRYIEPATQDIFLHVHAFVYKYNLKSDGAELNDKVTKHGQLSWSKLDSDNILPEVYDVKGLVAAGKFAYVSATYVEPPQLLASEAVPLITSEEKDHVHPFVHSLLANTQPEAGIINLLP